MHTTRTDTLHFHHNGDYSGPVLFSVPWPAPEGQSYPDDLAPQFAVPFPVLVRASVSAADAATVDVEVRGNGSSYRKPYTDQRYTLTLPVADLRELIGIRIRNQRLAALEDMDGEELFDLGRQNEVATWLEEQHHGG